MWTEKNNSFENMLERLNLNPLPVIDEEVYKPWVLYSRPREMLKPNEYYFFAYLRNLRKRTHKYGFSDLSTFSGPHRCLTKGNKVLLSDGSWKNIEDVIIGDKVFSPQKDGSVIISKVVDTTSYYCDNVYDVIEAKGKNKKLYSCSGNHLIPLYGIINRRIKKGRRVERSIKEITAEHISSLKKAEKSRIVTFTTPPINFNKTDYDVDPYLLGLWLGDGHCALGKKRGRYAIGITSKEPEIINYLNIQNKLISVYNKKNTCAVSLRISCLDDFYISLQNLKLLGKKSGTKFIPNNCKLSSIQFRLKLLAGLIDTDGYVPKNKNNIEITTKSLNMANDILDVVRSLGGNGKVTQIKKKIKKLNFEGTYYVSRFSFNKEIMPSLIKEVKVPFKKNRLKEFVKIALNTNRNHKDYCPSRISIKCVKTESQKVYGITLDSPSHWFITNDWIVTCNSGKSTSACFFAWLLDDTFKDNFKKRVIYNPEDLDQYILNADKLYTLNKNNIGCAVVIDEAGNTLEALAYYSEFSRKFSTTLQTMGYLKSRIFFISPNRKNVASSIRSMANTHYNVKRPNSTTYTTVSPRELKYDHLRDTSWNKRPVIRYFGEKIMLQTLKIHGIPSEILKKYLEVEGYKSDMIKNKYSVQKEIEEKNKDEIDIDDAVRKVKDNLLHFLNMRENGVHIDAIAYQLKVSRRVSNLIKMRVERELKQEGYVFPGSSKKRIKEEEDE